MGALPAEWQLRLAKLREAAHTDAGHYQALRGKWDNLLGEISMLADSANQHADAYGEIFSRAAARPLDDVSFDFNRNLVNLEDAI